MGIDFDTSVIDQVSTPEDVRNLDERMLPVLAAQLRGMLVNTVSRTGGHLGAGLGVVELSIALHRIFNTPKDRLIWDVGHQAYPHKILTGRKDRMTTLRQKDGLSGFTKRSESIYDPFGAGHSSTSISAGLGMAVASALSQDNNRVISVIGDGSISAGMAYEAMNNAGDLNARLIIILNDNDMSIAKPVGAMSAYLARLISGGTYRGIREISKQLAKKLPQFVYSSAQRAEEYARGFWTGGTLFEELGIYYVGPIDGHNFNHLLPVLKNVRDAKNTGPILVHVVTQKGKGYAPAEKADDKFHGVTKFDPKSGFLTKPASNQLTYTSVFGQGLCDLAKKDEKVVAITAAMPSGTGLSKFAQLFPKRFFDVGIAEQHAVTFAAGLACEGFKPFVAIYSTFLQRAYDQIVHDVVLQELPVRFAIDRAGLVGADGATHMGAFDISYLGCLPGMVIMAPSDEAELVHMLQTAYEHDLGPSVVRYPRGSGPGIALPKFPEAIPIGKGRVLEEGSAVAILSLGSALQSCQDAAKLLNRAGLSTTVADARFAKPIDVDLVRRLLSQHKMLVTVEEASGYGFGAQVMKLATDEDWLEKGVKLRCLSMPDTIIEQGSDTEQRKQAELDSESIVDTVMSSLKKEGVTLDIRTNKVSV